MQQLALEPGAGVVGGNNAICVGASITGIVWRQTAVHLGCLPAFHTGSLDDTQQ